MSKVVVIGMLILGLVFTLGANSICCSTGTALDEKTESFVTYDNIELKLSVEKTIYRSGGSVDAMLTVTNKDSSLRRFSFSSTQQYDFIVMAEEEEIWRWSRDKVFASVLTELILSPSESVKYQEKWPQEDNQGNSVSPSDYQIIGMLTSRPEMVSRPISVQIIE